MSGQAGTERDAMAEQEVEESLPTRLRQHALAVGPGWQAPTWFLLGVLVGVVGFAAFATLGNSRSKLDVATLRDAARDGTLDAIATLQAGGPVASGSQTESSNADPPTTGKTFAVREANRAGDKNASVTIVEFSDFQ